MQETSAHGSASLLFLWEHKTLRGERFPWIFTSLWPVLAGTVQAAPQPQQQCSLFVSLKLQEEEGNKIYGRF